MRIPCCFVCRASHPYITAVNGALPERKQDGKEADLPVRPPIEEAEAAKRDTKLEKHIAALARLRQTTNAPVYGEYADILVRNEQLVFVRQYNKEAVIAAFNIADTAVSLDFDGRVKICG